VAVRPRSTRGRGQHFLRSSKLAAELVRAARVQSDDLVLDLGAGTGALTAALARCTNRVIAVEIDAELATGLRGRFPGVEVLTADLLHVPLPREPFKVVANLPFDGGTAILRRLLDPRGSLLSADVVLQWDLACKRAAVWPSTQLGAYWGAWFELSVARRLPRSAFTPPPAVDAGVLRIVRREQPLVPIAQAGAYGAFLARGYRHGPRTVVPWRQLKRWESELGLDRHAQGRDLDAQQWAELFLRAVRLPG
jgi:16S rRNA A1518/A1519 N6-dimethyltransferase RsmA/KsgA/DIM1 with predicted DNA glycosylase/AP lyase activity